MPLEVSVSFRLGEGDLLGFQAVKETSTVGRAFWRVLHRAARVPARAGDPGWEWEGDADQSRKEGWAWSWLELDCRTQAVFRIGTEGPLCSLLVRKRERAGGRLWGPSYIRGLTPEWVTFLRTETQDHDSIGVQAIEIWGELRLRVQTECGRNSFYVGKESS